MPTDVLHKVGTQISFADHDGDFGPTAAYVIEQGTPTDVELDLASVADDAARQSAKVDLGATRPRAYSLSAALEFAATPVAGDVVEFYWAESSNATAGTGNPGGTSGVNSAYSGYSSNLDASLRSLNLIGTMVVTAQVTATVQIAHGIGILVAGQRWGSLVLVNRSGAALHSDDVEMNVTLTPIVDEIA